MIRVAVLGSTGSVGRSALAVMGRHPERFRVVGLAANRRVDALAAQVAETRARVAVIADREAWDSADPVGGRADWRGGWEEVLDLAASPDVDVVVNALVGAVGLEPTLVALRSGKRLALANKESLVAGGPLVRAAAREGGGEVVPVDSEHSAILQCLEGANPEKVARLVLTASGGPFRGWNPERLADVRPEDALRHPTWDMGAKITVDSATLANKALEVIEAHFLYDIGYEAIDVVVHPQSIVHSFVELVDGSVLAQMGQPTMELPILYALSYPERLDDEELRTYDPVAGSPLTFEDVDHESFPLFGVGVSAGRKGGSAPAAFNAANEVAVEAFLAGDLSFPGMAEVVAESVDRLGGLPVGSFEEVSEADREARNVAREVMREIAPGGRRRAGRRWAHRGGGAGAAARGTDANGDDGTP